MIEINSREKCLQSFINSLSVDHVYPESIVQGYQYGQVYVDNVESPRCCLFWHQSGFGYIAGECKKNFLEDILQLIVNREGKYIRRLALQTGNQIEVNSFFENNVKVIKKEQYLFEYEDQINKSIELPNGFVIKRIDEYNYDLLSGKIIPAFSWRSKEEFLKNGFGFCVLHGNKFVSAAFSAGISDNYVDIGVQTAPEYRGLQMGKSVSLAMIHEIRRQDRIPVWECNTSNTASLKTAQAVGFKVSGKHLLWIKA